MDNEKRLKFIRRYFRIAVFTLIFFMTSFGIMFVKAILSKSNTSGEIDLGMVYILISPVISAVLLLLVCSNALYWSKNKNKISEIGFALTTILTIPVAVFGFFTLVATLFMLIKLAIHP